MTDAANQYGTALYELAKEENLVAEILPQLETLQDIFKKEPEFGVLLSAPSVPKEERCRILDSVLKGQVHPYVLNFMKILTEKGYMKQFGGCCRVFRNLNNQDQGIVCVTAVTASPLSPELKDKLKNKLSSVTGKTIDLQCRLDPSCLGGVRLDFDGKQVDGTIRSRLEGVRNLLKNTVL